MTVSVLVPYRPDGGWRDTAWAWVRAWWARTHPGWQVVEGRCPPGPWCKALAVAGALARAGGDLLVIADADVVADGVGEAVAAVQAGAAWAVPHYRVHRLTAVATSAVYGGAEPARAAGMRGGLARGAYVGVAGGGMAVLPREAYERVPLDPRFAGWGQEDLSAALAWDTLLGRHVRIRQPMWHLWHPPAPRLNAHVGSQPNHALHVRYQYAARNRDAMAALVAEHAMTAGRA